MILCFNILKQQTKILELKVIIFLSQRRNEESFLHYKSQKQSAEITITKRNRKLNGI